MRAARRDVPLSMVKARGSGRRTKPRPHGPAGKRGDRSAREGPALFGSFSRSGATVWRDENPSVCARRRAAAKYRRGFSRRRGGPERGGTQQNALVPASRSTFRASRRARGAAPHGGRVVTSAESDLKRKSMIA